MKDYSNIQPNIGDGFLQRMQFDSLKRKNKDEKVNELVEKNRYKIDEEEREKVFNRLIDDANRRLLKKKEKEIIEEESNNIIKDQNVVDEKKYNEEEWNEIYKKRFKDYEEYKKKRMEIKREKEKIQKMIEEQEELNNLYTVKKLPEYKIKENTQRLYEDAKKRAIIKNKKTKGKNDANNNKNFTSFNDEEDASKYMKSHKSEIYNFIWNSENTSNYYINNDMNNLNYNYNEYNNIINLNNNYNGGFTQKSFDKRNLVQKNSNMYFTDNYNGKFNNSNYTQRKRKEMNYPVYGYTNDFTFNNSGNNGLRKYSDYKRNKNKVIQSNNVLPLQYPNEFVPYDIEKNDYKNEDGETEVYNNKQDNIVDNYLYNYCINRYFNKNSL